MPKALSLQEIFITNYTSIVYVSIHVEPSPSHQDTTQICMTVSNMKCKAYLGLASSEKCTDDRVNMKRTG